MREHAMLYKEQMEAIEKAEGSLRDLEFESDTGMPSVTMMFPSADGSIGPGLPDMPDPSAL